MLPNFLCLGAQKAGTTTLWHILNQHPDIYLSDSPRETKFFTQEQLYARGPAYYELAHFVHWNGQKAVGEKTPEYLFLNKVPQRIKETLGLNIKFIVCLRSPAQRAYSHFRHNYQGICEHLGFEQAIKEEPERINLSESHLSLYGYLARGYYYKQIKRYLDIFPKDNFLFLVFEKDILTNQTVSAQKIFNFLEVDENVVLDLPVSSGRPVVKHINYVKNYEEIRKVSQKILTDNRKIKKRNLLGNLIQCFTIRNKRDNSQRCNQLSVNLSKEAVVLTRAAQSGVNQQTLIVHNPSLKLIDFAMANEKNRPLDNVLSSEKEIGINKQYFYEDISKLEDLLKVDLDHWLKI